MRRVAAKVVGLQRQAPDTGAAVGGGLPPAGGQPVPAAGLTRAAIGGGMEGCSGAGAAACRVHVKFGSSSEF